MNDMWTLAAAVLVVATVCSGIGVAQIRKFALARNMLDVPNQRSSHDTPTPRGGGLAIVAVVIIGAILFALFDVIGWRLAGAILAGVPIAVVGYLDDRQDVSPLIRGGVHLAGAAAGIAFLGGMPPLQVGTALLEWGWLGHILGVVGTVWMINLFNFMDGIDGLATSEAVFVFGVGGVLLLHANLLPLMMVCILLVGACLGFLWWNWPPAKIFMGDVASGFLGYMVAIVAIGSGSQGFPLWTWLLLASVFFVDATFTLLRRIWQGEKWYAAHRSHAYQHLTQTLGSHKMTTTIIIAINLLWVTPITVGIYLQPVWSVVGVLVGCLPLLLAAVLLRAGIHQ